MGDLGGRGSYAGSKSLAKVSWTASSTAVAISSCERYGMQMFRIALRNVVKGSAGTSSPSTMASDSHFPSQSVDETAKLETSMAQATVTPASEK